MFAPSLRSFTSVFTCAPKPLPPGPMKPIRMRSLAFAALLVAAAVSVVATVAPAADWARKLRRLTLCGVSGSGVDSRGSFMDELSLS